MRQIRMPGEPWPVPRRGLRDSPASGRRQRYLTGSAARPRTEHTHLRSGAPAKIKRMPAPLRIRWTMRRHTSRRAKMRGWWKYSAHDAWLSAGGLILAPATGTVRAEAPTSCGGARRATSSARWAPCNVATSHGTARGARRPMTATPAGTTLPQRRSPSWLRTWPAVDLAS